MRSSFSWMKKPKIPPFPKSKDPMVSTLRTTQICHTGFVNQPHTRNVIVLQRREHPACSIPILEFDYETLQVRKAMKASKALAPKPSQKTMPSACQNAINMLALKLLSPFWPIVSSRFLNVLGIRSLTLS